eukprot:5856202-Pyramimonas_sp.AAC.1
MDVKGYCMDGKGYLVDVKGYIMDVKGYIMDVKGVLTAPSVRPAGGDEAAGVDGPRHKPADGQDLAAGGQDSRGGTTPGSPVGQAVERTRHV